MLKIYHAPRARSHRIIWLCEEMGVPYEAKIESLMSKSDEFTEANPLGAFPAIRDGDLMMIESVAIMIYLMGKYGPTDLEVKPNEVGYPRYLQFLLFGEAGLAMYGNPLIATKFLCPEDQRDNWTAGYLKSAIRKRLVFIEDELSGKTYIMGDRFTAADISLGYSLSLMKFACDIDLSPALLEYTNRLKERPAFQRAIAVK